MTTFSVPAGKYIPLAAWLNPTPLGEIVGAVASASPTRVTIVPAAAEASVAEAPEMVVDVPIVGTIRYCSVDAVALLAVTHTDTRSCTVTSPVEVKIVSPFTITAVADTILLSSVPDICAPAWLYHTPLW